MAVFSKQEMLICWACGAATASLPYHLYLRLYTYHITSIGNTIWWSEILVLPRFCAGIPEPELAKVAYMVHT